MVVKGGEYYSKLRIMIVLIEFLKSNNTNRSQN